jgi:hypothetical protein
MISQHLPGALSLPDFLAFPWPEPTPLLSPWLYQGGIAELYGLRGAGKTNVTIALALAVATGTAMFTHMYAPKRRRVLYIDGEMHPAQVTNRFHKFLRALSVPPPPELLYMSHAAYPDGIPTLYAAESGGRQLVEQAAAQHRADLIIFDNISALVRGGEENNNDAWEPVNEWLLGLRRLNYTSLLIHHAGKRQLDGTIRQRGNSKKEDPMDAVIQIDETAKPKGGRVPLRWTYEKCRSFTPEELHFDFSVVFDDSAGKAWLEEGNYQSMENQPPPPWLPKAQELLGRGLSLRHVAQAIGVPKSTLHRWVAGPTRTLGELSREGHGTEAKTPTNPLISKRPVSSTP